MPSFIIAGYVWQILGRGDLLPPPPPPPPIPEQPRESPSWIGLKHSTPAFFCVLFRKTYVKEHLWIAASNFAAFKCLNDAMYRFGHLKKHNWSLYINTSAIFVMVDLSLLSLQAKKYFLINWKYNSILKILRIIWIYKNVNKCRFD